MFMLRLDGFKFSYHLEMGFFVVLVLYKLLVKIHIVFLNLF